MARALADFRIENDRVVLLSFTDGINSRVSPSDLSRHLGRADLLKVQEALRLRKQFIKKVLPPTATIVLLVGILSLGGYDAYRLTQMRHNSSPQTIRQEHSISSPSSSNQGTDLQQKARDAQPTPAASTGSTGSDAQKAQPRRLPQPSLGPTTVPVTQILKNTVAPAGNLASPIQPAVQKVTDPLLKPLGLGQ